MKRLPIIEQLKSNRDPDKTFKLDITNNQSEIIGKLRLIDWGRATDPELLAALTKWRNNSMRFFLSQFKATEKRTREWLETVVLPSENRLLFELLDSKDRSIGNAGVCNLTEQSAELDNFIRGEPGGAATLFVSAEKTLINWLFVSLGVQKISLHVFSNNWIPIANHLSIGFEITQHNTLTLIHENDVTTHLVNSTQGAKVPYSYLKMELSRENLFR